MNSLPCDNRNIEPAIDAQSLIAFYSPLSCQLKDSGKREAEKLVNSAHRIEPGS